MESAPGFNFRWARKFDGILYDPPSDLREILRFVSDVVLDSVFHLVNCLQFISIKPFRVYRQAEEPNLIIVLLRVGSIKKVLNVRVN